MQGDRRAGACGPTAEVRARGGRQAAGFALLPRVLLVSEGRSPCSRCPGDVCSYVFMHLYVYPGT